MMLFPNPRFLRLTWLQVALLRMITLVVFLVLFTNSIPAVMAEYKMCSTNPGVKFPPGLVFVVYDENGNDLTTNNTNKELACNKDVTVQVSEGKYIKYKVIAQPEAGATYQYQEVKDANGALSWTTVDGTKPFFHYVLTANQSTQLNHYTSFATNSPFLQAGTALWVRVYDVSKYDAKKQNEKADGEADRVLSFKIKFVADGQAPSLREQLSKSSSATPNAPKADFSGFLPDDTVATFANPMESETVGGLIARTVQMLLILAGLSATAVIAISGFQLVLSAGAPEKRATAIKAITGAVIGLIVTVLSFSIVAILKQIIS